MALPRHRSCAGCLSTTSTWGRRGLDPVGRAGGRAFVASSFGKESLDVSRWADGTMPTSAHFPEALRGEGTGGLQGILFWDVGASLICLGNTEPVPFSAWSPYLPSPSPSRRLYSQRSRKWQPETGLWVKMDRLKLVSRLEIKVDLSEIRGGRSRSRLCADRLR